MLMWTSQNPQYRNTAQTHCQQHKLRDNITKHLADILTPLVGNTPHHIENSIHVANKVKHLKMVPGETLVSSDVISFFFICTSTTEVVETIRKCLQQHNDLKNRTNFTPDQMCAPLYLCLFTTYFKLNGSFYRQKRGYAMGSPVSPIVANLYMEEKEQRALDSFKGTTLSRCFRYVDGKGQNSCKRNRSVQQTKRWESQH